MDPTSIILSLPLRSWIKFLFKFGFGMVIPLQKAIPQLFSSLTPTAQLAYIFPEECVADLGALWQRLQGKYQNRWLLKLIMFRAIVESFWAFYIQIKIENFSRTRKADTSQLRD